MEALCVQIFDAGLTQHAQRTAEVESFFTCSHEAVADNRQKAAQIAAAFESSRRPVSFFSLRQAGKTIQAISHQLDTTKCSQMKFHSIAENSGDATDRRCRATWRSHRFLPGAGQPALWNPHESGTAAGGPTGGQNKKTYRCILLTELLTPKFEHLSKMLILRPWSKFRWVFS